MNNLLKILFVSLLFFSCSSVERNNYKILESYMKDSNRIKSFEEMCNSNKISIPDTIFINGVFKSNRTVLRHIFSESNGNQNVSTFWIDCKEKLIVSNSDSNYIETQISKLENSKMLHNKKLTFNNFKVIDEQVKKKSIVKNSIIYSFSKPIIILDNNYSIFYFESFLDTLENHSILKSNYIIMKNENKKWIYLGELCENNIID